MSIRDEEELDALLDAEEAALWSGVGGDFGGDDGWGEDADGEFQMGPCAREARLQHGDWCWNDFSSDDEDGQVQRRRHLLRAARSARFFGRESELLRPTRSGLRRVTWSAPRWRGRR
eukprot:COSAG01_NODE_22800_length_840_cov_5.601889_1_plen_117_part_00